jgi:hypothetical protein
MPDCDAQDVLAQELPQDVAVLSFVLLNSNYWKSLNDGSFALPRINRLYGCSVTNVMKKKCGEPTACKCPIGSTNHHWKSLNDGSFALSVLV